MCVCVCVCACACACADSLVIKMFHLSAATCQDVPSLGREGLCIYLLCMHVWL